MRSSTAETGPGIRRDIPDLEPALATVRPVASPSTSASVAELVEDWLTAKRALELAEQVEKGNSHRTRRANLARWVVF